MRADRKHVMGLMPSLSSCRSIRLLLLSSIYFKIQEYSIGGGLGCQMQ